MAAIPVTLKFDEDKYNEDKRKLIIKMTLPASWASKPASKLAAAIAKAANAKPGGVKIAPECLALFAGDGAPIPPDAPIGGLPDGAAVRARDAPVASG